jgi:SAM-dependent methyltransferase
MPSMAKGVEHSVLRVIPAPIQRKNCLQDAMKITLAYRGVPPWDTGRPNPEIVSLEEAGWISGSVLDAGCGTGENALYLASRGHERLEVDSASFELRHGGNQIGQVSARRSSLQTVRVSPSRRLLRQTSSCGLPMFLPVACSS